MRSEPDRDNLRHDRPPLWIIADPPWHIDAVGGRSHHQSLLTGALRLRVRDICRQVCRENEVDILRGVLSSAYVHMLVSVSPKLPISDLVRKMKGRSSHKMQRELPAIRKRY